MLIMFFVLLGSGCQQALIKNYDSIAVPEGLTANNVRRSIVDAGVSRGWLMDDFSESQIVGKLNVRTHYISIDIAYSSESYSISYKESSNMKAKGQNIHKKYNSWISNLISDTNTRLYSAKIAANKK